MTQAPAAASGLVRVTVTSGSRRVDLVLPGAIPVAELVPELARSVGLLDAATVYGGYQVALPDGRVLVGDAGLIPQGVEDGGVLTVTAGVDRPAPRVYDDVVEAMTDVVEQDLTPWKPEAGRRTALASAALMLVFGAFALVVQGPGALTGAAALVISAVLVGGAIVLSRSEREAEAAVGVSWLAELYAAVGGLLLGIHLLDSPLLGLPLACAGGGAVVAGLLCLLAIGDGRTLALPGVVVGVVLAAVGALHHAVGWDPSLVLVIVLTVVVLFGSVFPWLALTLTPTDVDRLYSPADITADPAEVDAEQVSADARNAHEILLAISATIGLLMILVAPLAVGRGLWGTLLLVACCLVVMLRTRQYRTGSEVLVGLGSGILGLLVVALSVLWLQPDWRPATAVVLAAVGGLLLALTLLPSAPSVRRGRIGDVAETVALLALVPLLLMASGVLGSVNV